MKHSALAAAALGTVLMARSVCFAPPPPRPDPAEPDVSSGEEPSELIWANAACYVCHTTFVKEELSRVHLEAGKACIDCHGLSAAHANDENIGATPPDVTYARGEVDASCQKCHDKHDVPARDVIARWLQRRPPSPPICSDCHGTHRIADAAGAR